MAMLINLEEMQKNTKKFYEICSDISILQRELDEMLVAIEKNSADFEKGKISKDLFSYNESRMKKESAKLIKKINGMIDEGVSLISKINKEVESQKIQEKKDKKKNRLEEIKKMKQKPKKKKIKHKKKKVTEIAETAPLPEQKVEQGS